MKYAKSDFIKSLPQSGSYLLLIYLKKNKKITVGRKGIFAFPKGFYIYSGRAGKALPSRIKRHLVKRKKKKWQIDYLTSSREAKVFGVYVYNNPLLECKLSTELLKHGWEALIKGFGSSDCKNNCPSHLLYSNTPNGKITLPSCFFYKLNF